MKNKVQLIKTLNDISNLITDENKEFLIAGIVESLNLIVDIKERFLKETGKYPVDLIDNLSISFDGKIGVDKISINGCIYDLKKPQ
jgi:ferredoxin-fold anticodon binding domain-containing protein